jgi:hypothetical protein
MDDWDEIFKGPHWNLLANGEWATANFKPWNYCLIVFIVYMWYIESCKMLFIWKKSRCSKNKNKKRGATSLKKKRKKKEQHRVLSTITCDLIFYLNWYNMFTFVNINHHVRVHLDKQPGNNFESHLRSNCVLEIAIKTKY